MLNQLVDIRAENRSSENQMQIPLRLRTEVFLQRFFVRLLCPTIYLLVLAWMKYQRGYSIPGIRKFRDEFKRMAKDSSRPVLICANHLTLIDSFILIWALGDFFFYVRNPKFFAWNLPEKMNFYRNPFSRLLCYLGKCVPVIRGGGKETSSRTRDTIRLLVEAGESIMIFPEGTRSRRGVIDPAEVAYASGAILEAHPELRVLCVYLRGAHQKTYGNYPRRDERFFLDMAETNPQTSVRGLRAHRELSRQIILTLKEMENGYFEKNARRE